MWGGTLVRYVERAEDVRLQWELYDVVKFEHLRRLFPRGGGTRSLECGCGSASVSLFFAKRGYEAVTLDFAPNALALARRNFLAEGLAGRFVCADVEGTPFPDGAYDVVMSFGLIEHFVDVRAIIQEMVRLVRPGGVLFLDIVPKRFNVQTIANITFNWYAALAHGLLTGRPREGWLRARALFAPPFFENSYRMEQYAGWMEEAGLMDVRISGCNPFPRLYLPGPLDRIFVQLLIGLLPWWRRFDAQQDGWFKKHWARAWWAHGVKPA
jgi:ubiquinone/menaquinone biosynthesis C-methylase UbiE